ncbi:MAG: hypothetical protein AAF206_01525 [Bacteroidota bacterium]
MKFLVKTAPVMSMIAFLFMFLITADVHAQKKSSIPVSRDGRTISTGAKASLAKMGIKAKGIVNLKSMSLLETEKNGFLILDGKGKELPKLTGSLSCRYSGSCNGTCQLNQSGQNITCYCNSGGQHCTLILKKVTLIKDLGIKGESEKGFPGGQTTLKEIGEILRLP